MIMSKNPEFIVYTGPMMSGKTSKLLMKVERFKFQKQHVFAFKPKIDDRYSTTEITTHMGWKLPATCVANGEELLKELSVKINANDRNDNIVVAVDELFMIPGVSEPLIWLFKIGVTVVVSTLELSWNCQPFAEVSKILPFATVVDKCFAVCTVCQRDAYYSWRRTEDKDEILVGGSELYEARCYKHHPVMNNGEK